MIDPYKKDVQIALKKTIGSLLKVEKMIEEDAYCMDISQQVNAALGLLRNINLKIFESHLSTCAKNGLDEKDPEKKAAFIHEMVKNFDITCRK